MKARWWRLERGGLWLQRSRCARCRCCSIGARDALSCFYRRYFVKKSTDDCDAFFKRKTELIGEQVMWGSAWGWGFCVRGDTRDLQLGRLEKQIFSTKNKMDNIEVVLQQRMRR